MKSLIMEGPAKSRVIDIEIPIGKDEILRGLQFGTGAMEDRG